MDVASTSQGQYQHYLNEGKVDIVGIASNVGANSSAFISIWVHFDYQ